MLTNVPEKINITEILKSTDAGIFTDHSVLMFDFTTSCKPLPRVIRYLFDYSRADLDGLRGHLPSLKLEDKISDNGDINQDWSDWKNTFVEAVKKFVPIKKLKGRKFLPWMNSTILHSIKKKNTLRMKIKRSSSPSKNI